MTIAFADWTFSGVVQDLPELSAYLADRLGWRASDDRRAADGSASRRAGEARAGRACASTSRENRRSRLGKSMSKRHLRWRCRGVRYADGRLMPPAAPCDIRRLARTQTAEMLAAAVSPRPPTPESQQTAATPPDHAAHVVTATGRPEEVSRIAGTIQIIPQERIARSTAKSVTELLAENAVGFMSEWTAGQTSINIRGAATEGQGRDFRSQVLVLINGHRAGTANVSKLSIADVERIEIVRGPSSVIYGSQNMGGVINIILKTGRTAPGTLIEAAAGSWTLSRARSQSGGTTGKYDWYAGGDGGTRERLHQGRQRHRAEHGTGRATAAPAPSAMQIDDEQPHRRHGRAPTASTMRASAARAPTSSPSTTATTSRSTSPTTARRRTAAAACSSRPTTCATSTISAIRARSARSTRFAARTYDRSQPPPARHRRHALPAAATSLDGQRAAARRRLGAQHDPLRTAIALTNAAVEPALAAGQQPDGKRLRLLCRGRAAASSTTA